MAGVVHLMVPATARGLSQASSAADTAAKNAAAAGANAAQVAQAAANAAAQAAAAAGLSLTSDMVVPHLTQAVQVSTTNALNQAVHPAIANQAVSSATGAAVPTAGGLTTNQKRIAGAAAGGALGFVAAAPLGFAAPVAALIGAGVGAVAPDFIAKLKAKTGG